MHQYITVFVKQDCSVRLIEVHCLLDNTYSYNTMICIKLLCVSWLLRSQCGLHIKLFVGSYITVKC